MQLSQAVPAIDSYEQQKNEELLRLLPSEILMDMSYSEEEVMVQIMKNLI